MERCHEFHSLCRRWLLGWKAGSRSESLESILKRSLTEGYAKLGSHYGPDFFERQTEACQHRLAFLFSERFCRKAQEHEEAGTLTETVSARATYEALVWSATRLVTEIASGRSCADE